MEILIGLGGNLGDVPAAFALALDRLAAAHRVVEVSGVYRSDAVGPVQPSFLNMAVVVELGEPLRRFLDRCHRVESEAGRDRDAEQRWGPRTLDIDLLIAGPVVRRGPRLELPHARLHERAFALVPSAELRPRWIHPLVGRSLRELAAQADAASPGAVRPAGRFES